MATTSFVAALVAVLAPTQGAAQTRVDASEYARVKILERDYAYVSLESVWVFPPGRAKVIFVCWENPSEQDAQAREWVRDSIARTSAKHSGLTFRGWKKCAKRNAGIRILAKDVGPHVKTS